jgi:hypothetical protein
LDGKSAKLVNEEEKESEETTNIDEDMSSPELVKMIAKEWDRELKRIKEKGLNGYKRRKEAKGESLL